MYKLRFYQDNVPPVLNDRMRDIQYSNYIIGAPNDPHWRLYPKDQYMTVRNMLPITYAVTDYPADENHYVFYMPESRGPTWNYSRLLRDHFEVIHKDIQQANYRKQEKSLSDKNEKIKQLKSLLLEQQQLLKKFKDELPKLNSKRNRAISAETRGGLPREVASANYDKFNPMYLNTLNSVKTIETNIDSLKKELKSYKD